MSQSTTTPSGTPKPRCRLWVRVLLFVSLALNLAVFGVVGGAVLNVSRGDERPDRIARELGLGPYLYAMDKDNRTLLQAETAKRKPELKEGRKAWRSALSETLDVLRSEPFDEGRFLELIELQAENADRQRKIGQELLAGQLSEMAPELRAAYADALERQFRFGGNYRDQGGRGEGRMGHQPNQQKKH